MKKDNTGEFSMYVHNRIIPLVLVPLAALALSACDTDKPTTVQDSIVTAGPVSNYDLAESVIPFPNDLLFQDDTPDGTINIPVDDENDLANPQVAINGLDGFSTVAPMSTGFSTALADGSISAASVKVFEVVKGSAFGLAGPVTSVTSQLEFGVDYIATVSTVDPTGSTLVIVPLKPLKPKTSYAVLVTDSLTGTDGRPVASSISYLLTRGADPLIVSPPSSPISSDDILAGALKPDEGAAQMEIDEAYTTAATLDAVRQIVYPSELALVAADAEIESSADVILHWSFTTQSTSDVLAQLRSDIRSGPAPTSAFLPTGPVPSPLVAADLYVGTLDVPYYLAPATGINDPSPLASFWKGIGGSLLTYLAPNPGCLPAGTNVCVDGSITQTIPLMVSVPKVGSPPWPVVIYQHGITTNRATMLAVADAMAGAGMAVVAIDMPMHGLTGNETNGTENYYGLGAAGPGTVTERTFDLDLVTQDSDGNITDRTSDGVTDTSGIHYINLSNLQNTRDNVRQSVSDLFSLTYALTTMDYGTGADFDTTKVYFLGHSLGAMVGTTFLAHEPTVRDGALAFGGTSLPKILDGSASFGPTISAGLAAEGVEKGTPDYESFIGAAQTVVDSGDPVNHSTTAATGRGILFFEIVGDGTANNLSDLVVPNTVPDGNDTSGTVAAPLAGTEPQLALMGLTQVDPAVLPISGPDLHLVSKYISGEHSSLLDPAPNPVVTQDIQTQAAGFFLSDGMFLDAFDPSVLQAP